MKSLKEISTAYRVLFDLAEEKGLIAPYNNSENAFCLCGGIG